MRFITWLDQISKVKSCPDLLPENPLAFPLAGLFSGLFAISPRFAWGVMFLFILNVVVSAWLEAKSSEHEYVSLVQSVIERAVGYMIGLAIVHIIVWMFPSIKVLQTVVYGAIAGIEGAVSMAILARIIPRMRPVYLWLLKWANNNTPFDLDRKKVNDIIESS